jgi:predicted nuclease with RNAse H fold
VDCVVGIDLSGLHGGLDAPRTVAALIELRAPLHVADWFTVPRGSRGDISLVEWVQHQGPLVVAIDAPLTIPHSVTCVESDCPRCALGSAWYTQREVDRAARRLGGGMPAVMLAAISFRGIYLAHQLRGRGFEVIETYPAASYRAMGALGKTYEERARLLNRRLGVLERSDRDSIDAACAALAAADYAGGRAGAIESGGETIWLVG